MAPSVHLVQVWRHLRTPVLARNIGICLALVALTGCAALPSSGPEVSQVMRATEGPAPAFKVVDITAEPLVVAPPAPADSAAFGGIAQVARPTVADQVEIGDTLQVTVFEVGPALFDGAANGSSVMTSSTAMGAPSAKAEALPATPVGPDGFITVPYVGRVKAAGSTPAEIAALIEDGLRGKSQSPQVVVSVREDIGNTVVMIGDIKSPGRKLLSYRRESLLDLIAMAGGPTNPKPDTIIRITRDGQSAETRLGDVRSSGPDDIVLQPGDRIELIFQPRTFTAFGATGKVSEISFQSTRLTLAEALARMGGPLDQQADSTGVFIFRGRTATDVTPVVYRLSLKDPRGYLAAQAFQVHDKDLIFVANAQSNAWYKFLSIVNTIVTPVVTAKYLGN
jgi:polysaccharide export outer membrane protein